jgi:toxin HigB-1
MIKSFKDKLLRDLFEGNLIATTNEQNKIRKRLESIDSAFEIEDLRLPGYDLHELKGNRKGTSAIKISGNWRITFRFGNGQANGVDYEDYH